MLLNYWVKKEKIPTLNMDWRWNGLFKGIDDKQISNAHFIHFFLKDPLPQKRRKRARLNECNKLKHLVMRAYSTVKKTSITVHQV